MLGAVSSDRNFVSKDIKHRQIMDLLIQIERDFQVMKSMLGDTKRYGELCHVFISMDEKMADMKMLTTECYIKEELLDRIRTGDQNAIDRFLGLVPL